MAKTDFLLSIDTDNSTFTVTNVETGETKTVELHKTKKTSTKTTKKDDGDPTPKITLEDNKLVLNSAAAELLADSSADENRIDVKYEKQGKVIVPIIGNDTVFETKAGKKLTKSNTLAFRGKCNDELAKYGSVFTLETHPTKEGLFIMRGNEEMVSEPEGDENFSIPEEDQSPVISDDDLNLDGLLTETTETDDFDFTL